MEVWCDEGCWSLEGNRRLDDEDEGVRSEACEDDNDAASADGNDDEYLVQPVVVAVLPIGSTGATNEEGSQDDNDGDGVTGGGGEVGGTVCGALDETLAIATLDVVERGKDGGGCWYFDAFEGGGPGGNGPLPVSWE